MLISENVSLRSFNTFNVDATARYFASFSSITALQEILSLDHKERLVIGGGSNILLTQDFDGLVMQNDLRGISVIGEDAAYYYVKAGAGEIWHEFVQYCVDEGYGGVENLSLIPGRVGASPIQNIGAYGVEISDVFHSLEAYHIGDKTVVTFDAPACCFGYRESVFKRKHRGQFIILSVTYKLRKHPVFNISYGALRWELELMGVQNLSLRDIASAVIRIRRAKLPDPAVVGNAGSFFKNPVIQAKHYRRLHSIYPQLAGFKQADEMVKVAAGSLLEIDGWKGKRDGDVGSHDLQALVLVNHGNATGKNVASFAARIIDSVFERFGIRLIPEVNFY